MRRQSFHRGREVGVGVAAGDGQGKAKAMHAHMLLLGVRIPPRLVPSASGCAGAILYGFCP